MTAPAEIFGLSNAELQQLVLKLLGENTEQKRAIVELRGEITRLKGLKGRPDIKPSGMEQRTTPKRRDMRAGRRGRGKVTPWVSVEETLLSLEVPPGSRFKGYEDFVVQCQWRVNSRQIGRLKNRHRDTWAARRVLAKSGLSERRPD